MWAWLRSSVLSVRKAEDVLGVHIDENRLQIELALLACRWLGVAVLRSDPHRV